jgi:exonuclease SbcC
MIPLTLNLRNFMSYTDVHEPLRLDGVHVAVLTGDNGHGKSALLDAMTWALWGRARARSVDELIHAGASEMEVEFEFELDEHQYRVIRKRQRRGKSGYSDLQFAVLSDDGYRPLTERSVSETERLIERTLRMSYETFTNSSFIQQGRADSFTTNSPAERKRILAEILELGYYDELEGRAKERFKTSEAQLADERRLSQDWEAEIARRPTYQAELDRLRGELTNLEAALNDLEQQLTVSRERVAQLDSLQVQLKDTRDRLERFSVERARCSSNLRERQTLLKDVQAIFARADEIERAAAELDAVRRELEETTHKQQRFLPLERARATAARTLAAEQARLEGEVAQREQRLAELRQAGSQLAPLQAQLRRARSQAAVLAKVEAQHAELQAVIGRAREDAAEKRTINTRHKTDMLELRARLDELETLSMCPTCKRPMDARHKQRLRSELVAEGTRLRDEFRANEAAYRDLETAINRDEALLAQAAAALQEREAIHRRVAQTESVLQQAEDSVKQADLMQREVARQQHALREGAFAADTRAELARVDAQIAALAYDEQRHVALRQRATALAGAERERELLAQARLSAGHLQTQIGELEATLERLAAECTADEARCAQLSGQVEALAGERERLTALTEQSSEARRARDETRDQCLFAQTRIDNCAFLERKQRDSLARQDALRREQSIYGDLAYAFGRRGVQAMIIETAIPEIEEEANRILARMTDGRMHVRFETQRDVRSGIGTIETLDIKIADELGTRSYEMFSGGEGFRVNFAIRIALSRLLAHRAGTRLQLLVVDEGFGSQDQQGRDRIVEAIQAIEAEFEKILVITHLEDLRERFPVRIEVSKTAQGSTYALR